MTAQVPAIAGRADLTVIVAPGAGRGAPACFLPATAEIEVNGDHLPVDPATANPASPADRERYPALWGATMHECAHAAHSRWRAPEGTSAAWSAAATALEESRIEARQVRRRPGDRTWLRASTSQIVIRDFAAAATPPASPAEAGSAAGLILAREQAAQGRRVLKAAASGRRGPATRPGGLRDLAGQHLRQFPEAAFTPHQIGKVLTRSSGAVANTLDKLTALGAAQMVTDKPRSYRLAPAPAPDAAGDPGTSAEAAPSAA
jgi:hypothetical protein